MRRTHLVAVAIVGIWASIHVAGARAAEAWMDAVRVEPFVCRADFTLGSYEALFEELRRVSAVSEKGRAAPVSRFSAAIREGLPGMDVPEVNGVSEK